MAVKWLIENFTGENGYESLIEEVRKQDMNKINKIHKEIKVLIKEECWWFIDEFLFNFKQQIWRTDINELVAYATATLPAKEKLPSRSEFMRLCMTFFPNKKLWKGLK